MQPHPFIADRATLDHATDLLRDHGPGEPAAAAARAGAVRSRDLGNLAHFCRWRQVERLVRLLSAPRGPHTLH